MAKKITPNIVYPVNNGYVNDANPTIHGTGEPGASISGQIDSTSFSTSVLENGVWYYKVESELTNLTEHTLSFSQTNAEGQVYPQTNLKFRTDTQQLLPHTLTFPSNNQIINSNSPKINGTGKPGATIEANISGSAYNTIVNPNSNWQIPTETLPEGSHFINVVQKDMGNQSPSICSGFSVDTTAPSEPILDFPNDQCFINNPLPVICGKGEPNASINAVVDDKKYYAQANAQGNWSFEISEALVDDAHIISARQMDLAGNISPESISIFTTNTEQPNPPVITSPINGSIIADSTPVFSGQGEKDCVIVTSIYGKLYSAEVSSDGSWELKIFDSLDEGAHTFQIFQVDKAGNTSSNIDLTIKIDTLAPAAPIIIYPEKGKYVNATNFTVRGTGEPDSFVICSVAGNEYQTRVANDGSWLVDISGGGNIKYKMNYTITAKQIDLAGNSSTSVKTDFIADKDCLKAPEVNFPVNNSCINTVNPQITGNGKAGATINLSVNNNNYSTKVLSNNTWTITEANLPLGENTITLSQTDCGNVSPINTVSFNVKLSPPPCPTIISPTKNQNINNKDLVIKGEGEIGAKVNILLDDACYATNVNEFRMWEFVVADLIQGSHCILVNQIDSAGNESLYAHVIFVSFSENPQISSDSCPTSFQISYNPDGPDFKGKTIATLKTSNPITVNSVLGNTFSMIVLANGLYDFNYTEAAGNSGVITAGVSWIDNKPPIIQIEASGNYFSSEKTISIYKYGGSCIKKALINGVPFTSGTSVSNEGSYKIEVSDEAGNTATDCFIIDRTAPIISGVENGMVYNTDVTINYSDNLSGIKSAVLNGSNILSGIVLTENGDYTLTLSDFADNTAEKYFKIKK